MKAVTQDGVSLSIGRGLLLLCYDAATYRIRRGCWLIYVILVLVLIGLIIVKLICAGTR